MKKIVGILICTILLIPSVVFASGYFKDVTSDNWAYSAINSINQLEIINGYPDGTFRPNNLVTKAESAKIIVHALGLKKEENKKMIYSDVPKSHWAYDYIRTVNEYFVEVPKDGELAENFLIFNPESYATREEIAVALVKALNWDEKEYDIKTIDKFLDSKSISEYAKKYIAIAVENNLIKGNSDGTFNPKGNIRRSEIAQMIFNTLYKLNELSKEEKSRVAEAKANQSFGEQVNYYEKSTVDKIVPRFIPAEGVTLVTKEEPDLYHTSVKSSGDKVYYISILYVSDSKGDITEYEWYTYLCSGDQKWERINYNGKITKNDIKEDKLDYEKRHEELSELKKKYNTNVFEKKSNNGIDISGDISSGTYTIGSSFENEISKENTDTWSVSENGERQRTYTKNGITYLETIKTDEYGNTHTEKMILSVTPINKNYDNSISLECKIGDTNLVDGKYYYASNKTNIDIAIKNASSGTNYIYYMFVYGSKPYTTNIVKVPSSKASITIPDTMPAGIIGINVWGYSIKNGKSYSTDTYEYYLSYSKTPLEITKADFIVRQNNIRVEPNVTLGAKVNDNIKIMATPVDTIKTIEYKWDNEEVQIVNASDTIIKIPKLFLNNSIHTLTITIKDGDGNIGATKQYTFKIGTQTVMKGLDFIVVYNGETIEERKEYSDAKADKSIIIRCKPVNNVKTIKYKWDDGEFESIEEGATATISIPKGFEQGSKHTLTIIALGLDGTASEQKEYTFVMAKTH